MFKEVEDAVTEIRKFAWQSIGNGGIGVNRTLPHRYFDSALLD